MRRVLQSSLFFETAAEIYARVFRELKPRTPVPELDHRILPLRQRR